MSGAKNLVILGAGGQAKVVITTARLCGYDPVAIYDDDESKIGLDFAGVPVAGRIVDLPDDFDKSAFIAIGSNLVRKKISQRLQKAAWVSFIHPTAFVCATARIGHGTIICAGARIMVEADIGNQVIVNTGANIDHECRVGDYVHICPGCNLAGAVELEEGCFIGTGASIIPLKKIGAWAVVGAGAVVTKNVPENVTVVGVPARILKK
ncbi:MAG: acetyltransferase [Candidatus Riflebacteria bacterium]